MRRKPLSAIFAMAGFLGVAAVLGFPAFQSAAPALPFDGGPAFLGSRACGSSGCHGGGGQSQNQSLVWSLRDFHSQRPVATLTTARSKQIADALQIKDPSADSRCIACHAPLSEVPVSRRAEGFQVNEGVSCESCHGPAGGWLRSHTRPDWTHADRVYAGMRDLKSLYVRANTCVACHQTVETPLLRAGHPELIFELDGQCVSQPRHWREKEAWSGAQSWFVGQAVALREISWQLSREAETNQGLGERWGALLWLLQKLDGLRPEFPALTGIARQPSAQTALTTLKTCDELARAASASPWTPEMSRRALKALTSASAEFQESRGPSPAQARRAERVVLALDRLSVARTNSPVAAAVDADLNHLFKLAQSIPDFDAAEFATALTQFARRLAD